MYSWQNHKPNKRKHIQWILAGLTLLFIFLLPNSLALAAEQVTVTIPTFDVTLNGRTMDGTYSKYPLIVYKDITYFPMTYYDSRLLGVQADWSKEDGLTVTKQDGYFYEYIREINEQKNKRRLTAKVAEGQITVNGKVIDNSKEDYPLLVCRDVTYFPLTWRFAAEEFGWDYEYTQEKGLVITNAGVTIENPKKWGEDSIRKFMGGAGSDSGAAQLVLPIKFKYPTEKTYSLSKALPIPEDKDNPLRTELRSYPLGLYNIRYGHDVIIHPMEQWEYQVCRLIGGRQEIIYWRKFSFFTGLLPQGHFASGGVWEKVPLWPSDVIKEGEYIFQLVPSGDISYEEVDTHLVKQLSMADCFLPEDDSGLYHSFIKVIITK